MSDTVNLQISESSQATANSISNAGKSSLKQAGTTDIDDMTSSKDHFHESMSKAIDEMSSKSDTVTEEIDGNGLPAADDILLQTAEDDLLQDSGVVLNGLNIIENGKQSQTVFKSDSLLEESGLPQTLHINKVTDLMAENANNNAEILEKAVAKTTTASLLASPVRQLLQSDTKSLSSQLKDSKTNIGNINLTAENVSLRPIDSSQLKLEGLDLQNLKNALSSQQAGLNASEIPPPFQSTADLQSSLLAKTSIGGDINILPTSVTASSTPVSSFSMQALPQAEITEQFGRTGWSQGMGKQIIWMANQNIKSAEIRLNPAHLGPIEVKLDINDDQINVALSSRHANVREAMEMALPKLREMFESNGLSLSDTDISEHTFAEQREQSPANGENKSLDLKAGQNELPQIDAAMITPVPLSTSMVDYYI